MKNNTKSDLLVENEEKIIKKKPKFRDTVLIRVSRHIKNEVKALSKRSNEPMSRIADWALLEHLKSVKPLE